MNYISAEQLTKVVGEKTLFQNISLGLNYGDKVGLIGINGSGKSSLLKVLAGLDIPDNGTVSIRKGIRVGFLGQNPTFDELATVYENVFSANHPLIALIKSYDHALATNNDELLQEVVDQMTVQNAWDYERQIKEIISRLGIGEMIDRVVSTLSGGQRKRVAMARILIEKPDFLILDEPTNHLDLETIEWLEELIHEQFDTLLLVTHDRYFLDRVSNQIMELDRGELYKYKGNYGYFLEKKAEREQIQAAEVDKAKNLMRKELDWIRRQPKARGTKAKYRIDAFEKTKEKASQARQEEQLELQMKMARQGGKVVEMKSIGKSFGDFCVISDFTHRFQKGEKVGIIGKNGMGKSTFLNLIAGNLIPDKGVVDIGETTVFGYYKQEEISEGEDKRLIDSVKEIAEVVELANGDKITAAQFLDKFLFPPAVQYTYLSKLSGGERRRMQLLKTLIKNPNFLILDEPTNDLDIGTLNILEEFLEEFGGTLLLVSHDRYFMDRLVEHIFVFEGDGQIKDFPGNYSDYREWKQAEKEAEKEAETKRKNAPVVVEATASVAAPKKRRSYKENREYESLEGEIAHLEIEKKKLSEELNSGISDHERLLKLAKQIEDIQTSLEEKELRWLELDEMSE